MSNKAPNYKLDKQNVDFGDRIDSGFDSITSREEERFDSGHVSYTPPTTTTHLPTSKPSSDKELVDNIRPMAKEMYATEEYVDSGFGSASMTDEEREKFIMTLRNPEQKPKDVLDEMSESLHYFLPDEDGDTFLQMAIIHEKIDLAYDVIQSCTRPALLNVENSTMQTALHLAVLTDQPEITRCLVAYGANVSCVDKKGNTPLHIASEMGLPLQVEMLTTPLDPQEDPGLQTNSMPENVDVLNYSGLAAIHLAARNNRESVIRKLVKVPGCNINIEDSKSGRTALHHAIECRSKDAMKILLKRGIQVNALSFDDCSALHMAVSKGMRSEVNTLIHHKADIHLVTRDDNDVFDLAGRNHQMLRQLYTHQKLKH
ncbi:ikappaB protein [Ciona intestinalis]